VNGEKRLLEGRDAYPFDGAAKKIQPCTLPSMCNADLDSIATSEKPADSAFVARYRK
jgi:hypothetical protein